MGVKIGGANMMFLGMADNGNFTNQTTGEITTTYKINLMDISTNDIHVFFTTQKNTVLLQQVAGLKIAQVVQVVFELSFDKFAVTKKQNPSKFKLAELYPAK